MSRLLNSRNEALARLLCPECGGMLIPALDDADDPLGPVACMDCETEFACRRGVLDVTAVAYRSADRIREYPHAGLSLDFFGFFDAVLKLGAYRGTDLEEEIYTLLGWLDLDPGAPLLLLGCGRGQLALEVARACPDSTLVACDDSLEELHSARVRLGRAGVDNCIFVHCDLERPPIRPGAFPGIVHFGLLHALRDERLHLEHLAPVLPAKGRLVGVSLARSNLDRIAEAQRALTESKGVRWVPMEELGKALMKTGWSQFRHEQPSNWMARFVAHRRV